MLNFESERIYRETDRQRGKKKSSNFGSTVDTSMRHERERERNKIEKNKEEN